MKASAWGKYININLRHNVEGRAGRGRVRPRAETAGLVGEHGCPLVCNISRNSASNLTKTQYDFKSKLISFTF